MTTSFHTKYTVEIFSKKKFWSITSTFRYYLVVQDLKITKDASSRCISFTNALELPISVITDYILRYKMTFKAAFYHDLEHIDTELLTVMDFNQFVDSGTSHSVRYLVQSES